MKIGDICRTRQGAPARYIGNDKALYLSAMCNELSVADSAPRVGGEEKLPLPGYFAVRKYSKGD